MSTPKYEHRPKIKLIFVHSNRVFFPSHFYKVQYPFIPVNGAAFSTFNFNFLKILFKEIFFGKKYREIFWGLSMSIPNVLCAQCLGKNKNIAEGKKEQKFSFAALMHIRLKYKRRSRLKDNTLNIPGKVFYLFFTGNRWYGV